MLLQGFRRGELRLRKCLTVGLGQAPGYLIYWTSITFRSARYSSTTHQDVASLRADCMSMHLLEKVVADGFQVIGVDIFDCDTRRISDEDEDDNSAEGRDVSPVQEFVKIKWNLNAPFRLARHPDLMRGVFHLINSRFLIDGINTDRWESLIGEYMELLAPGGWLQMIEFEWVFQSAKGQHLSNLERWWNLYSTALRSMRNRKDPVIARRLYHLMARAGFERLTEERKDIPIGAWTNGAQVLLFVRERCQRLNHLQTKVRSHKTGPRRLCRRCWSLLPWCHSLEF